MLYGGSPFVPAELRDWLTGGHGAQVPGPGRRGATTGGPAAPPVWAAVGARVEALLAESGQWTGGKQRLTATRLHSFLVAVLRQNPATAVGPSA